MYLYDVPSMEHPGHVLGSVVFGESFLDSAVRTLVPGTWVCNMYTVPVSKVDKTYIILFLGILPADSKSSTKLGEKL